MLDTKDRRGMLVTRQMSKLWHLGHLIITSNPCHLSRALQAVSGGTGFRAWLATFSSQGALASYTARLGLVKSPMVQAYAASL